MIKKLEPSLLVSRSKATRVKTEHFEREFGILLNNPKSRIISKVDLILGGKEEKEEFHLIIKFGPSQ